MLAKTLTVILALAAFFVQLVLTTTYINIDCSEYMRCLQIEKKHSKLMDTRLATQEKTFEAATIEAIRKVDGCEAEVMIAIDLEARCYISVKEVSFGRQIAKYVETCASGDYWTKFLGAPKPKSGGRAKPKPFFPDDLPKRHSEEVKRILLLLKIIFPDELIDKFREKVFERTRLYFDLKDPEVTSIFMNSIKGFDAAQKEDYEFECAMNEIPKEFDEYYKGKIDYPCLMFFEYYEDTMYWIDRASTVVSDKKRYLGTLPTQTTELFMQYKICKLILDKVIDFHLTMFKRFCHPELYKMTNNYDLSDIELIE